MTSAETAPLLVSDLVLDSASLAGQPLQLEQRSVVVERDLIRLDLALKGGESKEARHGVRHGSL